MIPAIMKIGTHGNGCYFLYGNKPLKAYSVGDHIKFKPQLVHGARWETGIIREIIIDMPRVELY